MKTTGKCPKCSSVAVLRIPGQVGPYGGGNNIPAGFWRWSSVKVSRYLCCQCGFSEEWIDTQEDIGKLIVKYRQDKVT